MRNKPRKPKKYQQFLIQEINGQQVTIVKKNNVMKYNDQLGTMSNQIKNINQIDGDRTYFSMYSGGKDSGAVSEWGYISGVTKGKVIFINTTIGISETREFVKKQCLDRGWDLIEITPPRDYTEFVMKFGFPKVSGHWLAMRWLKYKPMQLFARENKKLKTCLMSGARKGESDRRFLNTTTLMRDSHLWINSPLIDWSTFKALAFTKYSGLGISPAYAKIHMSGDCMCGSYGDQDERLMLKIFYPDLANDIDQKEQMIENRTDIKELYKKWGNIRKSKKDQNTPTLQDNLVCTDCGVTDVYNRYIDHKADLILKQRFDIFEERLTKLVKI